MRRDAKPKKKPHLQNSGKHYTYDYGSITKETNQDQPKEETHRARPGRAQTQASTVESGLVTLLVHQPLHQPGSPTEPLGPEFLLWFHYLGTND